MIKISDIAEHNTSEANAYYYVAQHVPNLLRMESRNIGVVVSNHDDIAARFMGESSDGSGTLDGRAIRSIPQQDLYRMWVRHWRKTFGKPSWEELIKESNTGSYSITLRGSVTSTSSETLQDICDYLYGTLVSRDGLQKAFSLNADVEIAHEIKKELRDEMRGLGLMISNHCENVRYPVKEDHDIWGSSKVPHHVSFFQDNPTGGLVIEPLNLDTPQKRRAEERAGYLANVYRDIVAKDASVISSTVVQLGEDKDNRSVKYALGVLENDTEIIDWSSGRHRKKFMQTLEKRAVAA